MVDCANNDKAALGCLTTPARNNYFYGKMMDVCHFEMEQKYFNRKRWLLNRMGLGYGVVCGLNVVDAENGNIQIEPGVAIDGLGREIIVPKTLEDINPRQLTDECGRPKEGETVDSNGSVWIYLAYHECPTELVPVLVGDCDATQDCAPSTICERYMVLVSKEKPDSWAPECPGDAALTIGDDGQLSEDSATFLRQNLIQECPTVNPAEDKRIWVPLARINLNGEGDRIHPDVRPLVFSNKHLFELLLCCRGIEAVEPPVTADLPTLKDISWLQGHTYKKEEILGQEGMLSEGFRVSFDRDIKEPPTGQAWFIVTLEYPVSKVDSNLLAILNGTVFVQNILLAESGVEWTGQQKAVFKPHDTITNTFQKTIDHLNVTQPVFCRIVIKCSFLRDEDENLVNSNSFGNLPVAGGDFESWFWIK